MSVSAPPQKPLGGPPPPPPAGLGPNRRPRGIVWRLLLGCVIVVLAVGGATAVFILEQVHTVVVDLRVNKPLVVDRKVLAPDYYGGPETLLLIGNDTRSVFKYYRAYVPNLANEMLLVRVDPSKPYISMISLPRELWVTITEPDGATYTNRLNSAYTYGTTTLLQTIKQITGVSVNHVIATTFTQFQNAINKLGCVYDTIDERYYHNNADGGAQYQNIDLQPGYQCLNGSEAEQFVSYRHTDTSQVRDARDQSFLLAVKQQYGPRLAGNIGGFEKVFGETVRTDPGLRSPTEILNFANLLITADGLRVRQVPFHTTACDGTSCPPADLTATPQQIQDSVHSFLFGGDTTPTRQVAAISHKISRRDGLAHLPLTPTLASNVAAERAAAVKAPFTAEFPKVQDVAGSAIPVAPRCTQRVQSCIRDYTIHAPDGHAYPIYVEVFSNGDLGQFYDVQGTTWTDAPLFANPNQTLGAGKRTYELYYDATRLQMVAWHEYGAWYWVHNTLTNGIANGELLAIAEQTDPLTPVTLPGERGRGRAVTRTRPNLAPVVIPTRTIAPVRTTTVETVGSIGGVVALLAMPVLTVGLVHRRRQVRRLRTELVELENRQARLGAAAEATRATREAPAQPSRPAGHAGPAPPPAPPSHLATPAGSHWP